MFLEVSSYLGWTLLSQTGAYGQGLLILFSILVSFCVLWFNGNLRVLLIADSSIIESGKLLGSLESILNDQIRKAHKHKNYASVVRFGRALSRHLFVEGFYKLRYEIGELVEDAAAKIEDKKSQVAALIDDIGWTLVLLRSYEKATSYIKHGLQVAEAISEFYWIAKGYRHLGAIEVMLDHPRDAIKYLEKALDYADSITDTIEKKEMIAGIYFDMSILEHRLGNYDKANKYCVKSKQLRLEVGDETRICRIFALEGKIAEAKQNYALAKDTFRQGLLAAQKLNRKDEIIRNYLGLARVLKQEGKLSEAKECLVEANKLLQDSPLPFDIYGQEQNSCVIAVDSLTKKGSAL